MPSSFAQLRDTGSRGGRDHRERILEEKVELGGEAADQATGKGLGLASGEGEVLLKDIHPLLHRFHVCLSLGKGGEQGICGEVGQPAGSQGGDSGGA